MSKKKKEVVTLLIQAGLFVLIIVGILLSIDYSRLSPEYEEKPSFLMQPIKQEVSIGERSFIFSKRTSTKSPVIIALHGSLGNSSLWFEKKHYGLFVEQALERGYVIIAPDSSDPLCEGVKQWDYTENSSDLPFFKQIFEWIELREDLDSKEVYVVGISMGGFMASRLAHEYPDKIGALAILSAGNAKHMYPKEDVCFFAYNFSKNSVKSSHPRTLLIHGKNDSIVPYQASLLYRSALENVGVEVKLLSEPYGNHHWYSKYNDDILKWFN